MMEETIVITGASNGIGRETALRLAARGANLVLAARNFDALSAVAKDCEALGVHVTVQITDVAEESDVVDLAETAVDTYGSITAWINIAGTSSIGAFTDTPARDFEAVMQTNFMGTVFGSRAALQQFQEQGHGTLINVSSVLGAVPIPYESAYVASKYAVRGFTASIRQEMQAADQPDIHVCTVMPATMATAIYDNAANRIGTKAKPIPPVYKPAMVATAIDRLLDDPKAETIVGKAGLDLINFNKLVPQLAEKLLTKYISKLRKTGEIQAVTEGNLRKPSQSFDAPKDVHSLPRYADTAIKAASLIGLALVAYKAVKKRP